MEMIDWGVAVATARRLARPGPEVSYAEAADVVTELRELTEAAEAHVQKATGLTPLTPPTPVNIVDRPGWVAANVEGFQVLLAPLLEKMSQRAASRPGSGLTGAVGSRITGVQLGSLLAYVSSRILGQYEVFLPPEHGAGRLTLVAPNIVEIERQLGVPPRDFRLWVCLHEVTHRTQFTAVPWLRGHVESEVQALLAASDLDPAALRARLQSAAGAVTDALRGKGTTSLLEAVQTPEQRAITDRLTALMTLLEGHAEHVMDSVGPSVVPSVALIRARFEQRRRHRGGAVDRLLRKLFGLDLKAKQYAEGAHFVRELVAAEGMERFNTVWTSPETLPTRAEILDPAAWADRVLRSRPALPA